MKRIIVILVVLNMLACNICQEEKLSELNSPSGKYVAMQFRRNCGATSSMLYHVNLRRAESSLGRGSKGIIEDGQVFITDEGYTILRWKDDNSLMIECEGCPTQIRASSKLSRWDDVTIEYNFHERR